MYGNGYNQIMMPRNYMYFPYSVRPNFYGNGMNGLLIRNTGSSSNLVNQTCSDFPANTEVVLGVSYNNGSWTVFKDDEVQSVTANYTPTTLNIIQIQQGTMTDLIIKPL